jgi:hypothetical protein
MVWYSRTTVGYAAITKRGTSNIARKPYIGRSRILDLIHIPSKRYIFDEMAVFLFTTRFQRYPILLSRTPHFDRRIFRNSSWWCHGCARAPSWVSVLSCKSTLYVGTIQKTISAPARQLVYSLSESAVFDCHCSVSYGTNHRVLI